MCAFANVEDRTGKNTCVKKLTWLWLVVENSACNNASVPNKKGKLTKARVSKGRVAPHAKFWYPHLSKALPKTQLQKQPFCLVMHQPCLARAKSLTCYASMLFFWPRADWNACHKPTHLDWQPLAYKQCHFRELVLLVRTWLFHYELQFPAQNNSTEDAPLFQRSDLLC